MDTSLNGICQNMSQTLITRVAGADFQMASLSMEDVNAGVRVPRPELCESGSILYSSDESKGRYGAHYLSAEAFLASLQGLLFEILLRQTL